MDLCACPLLLCLTGSCGKYVALHEMVRGWWKVGRCRVRGEGRSGGDKEMQGEGGLQAGMVRALGLAAQGGGG